ncbi:ABC transporter permease [Microbacterium sp. No. 7]|uniref:ABC transporter permease n=1 Tax=Microbacterium sp. No. 7 TaxID=1714373 RepID=UPI0006D1E832|nr:ABC transporter permease subunit [Microbacterium sp. No. 7]
MSDTLTVAHATAATAAARAPEPDAADERRERIRAALQKVTHPVTVNPLVVSLGILSWVAVAAVSAFVPDHPQLPLRDAQYIDRANPASIVIALLVAATWAVLWALSRTHGRVGAWTYERVAHGAAWLLGSGVFFLFWIFSTSKTLLFSPPYLIAPQEILERLWDSRGILGHSLGNSLLLLSTGFVVGLIAGLATGVVIGWYQVANYWVHPILVFIGPVPALAWVPIVFVLSPSSFAGAVFMIALSVWFPITVLTRAGILSAPRSYFDVAQTLGAGSWFLVFRVSLPAALPSIFTGAFMALGSAFATLVVAENFGVNSGLGYFLNWKKSFGDFPGLYAGIIVLIVVCGLALTLLFRIRNYVLRWEKELTRW